jgi:hypothetical protein
MTGDVVWSSGTFDGTGNVTATSTIQPNSVALGTDTTGDYVKQIFTGSSLTGDGFTEGSTPTLNTVQDIRSSARPSFAGVYLSEQSYVKNLIWEHEVNAGADHDMDQYYNGGAVASTDSSDRYLNLSHEGLTGASAAHVNETDMTQANFSGYSAQNSYSFKYDSTTTSDNDAQYKLGDIRFQFNKQAGTTTDNTDLSFRIFKNGDHTDGVRMLQVKYGSMVRFGPKGIDSGTPIIDFRSDRFQLKNHIGTIKLETTGTGGAGLIRLKSADDVIIESTGSSVQIKASSKIDLQAPAKLKNLSSAPSGGEAGMMYFNTTLGKAQCHDGSGWQNMW